MDTDLLGKLSTRLDREWHRLNRRAAVLETVRSWDLTTRRFETLDDLLGIAGFRRDDSAEADGVLLRLVAVAAHEPLACRIVLQRILPGLLAVARSEQARDPQTDAFEELVGEAWVAIVRYRVADRPTHVAARLINDARQRAITSTRRRRVVTEEAVDVAELDQHIDTSAPAAFDELVDVVAEARRRGLADQHVATVRDALRHDTVRRAAAACLRSDRAIRYRQGRAAAQIRRLATAS